ncbi:MAG TPA: hypothetical protein EYO37_07450 [Nitrospina sp.]|nr:hypothetical protein [Nitrospina sp.]
MSCSLCELKTILHVYDDSDPRWIIIDCMTCLLPMAVWRGTPLHVMEVSSKDYYEMEEALKKTALDLLGTEDFYIDKVQNQIQDHLHWHARPNDWKIPKIEAPIFVSTNDKHEMCLKVFCELFEKFFKSQKLNILGYTPPSEKLSDNFVFHSMGEQQAACEWSTGLIDFFSLLKDDIFIYGTEDVAFIKHTFFNVVNDLIKMMKDDPSIGRINLVDCCEGDEGGLENSPHYKVKFVKDIKICSLYEQTPESPYKITTQFSIWNKAFFLKYLKKSQTPWEFETRGSQEAASDKEYKVLMTYGKHFPVSKKEAFKAGKWENQSSWYNFLPTSLQTEIEKWNRKGKHTIEYIR